MKVELVVVNAAVKLKTGKIQHGGTFAVSSEPLATSSPSSSKATLMTATTTTNPAPAPAPVAVAVAVAAGVGVAFHAFALGRVVG